MRFLRCRRSRAIKLSILFFVTAVLLYVMNFVRIVVREKSCSEEESAILMDEMCKDYKNNKIAGNLCHALCVDETIEYRKCANYRHGKTVLITECSGVCERGQVVKAVLKSKQPKKVSHYEPMVLPKYPNGTLTEDGVKMAKTIMENLLYYNMLETVDGNTSVFNYLWMMDINAYVKNSKFPGAMETALQSIWSLVQQEEYLFMKLNQNLRYVPKIYGTCGFYYLMEYAPPGNVLNPSFMYSGTASWKERAATAVELLEISQSLDNTFHERLHFCDIKEENFGINAQSTVKILDTDTLFFDTAMRKDLAQPRCKSHEDCDFFDCRGWCNISRHKCTSERMNDNVQNICEDIFIDRAMNFYSGLLHDPPEDIKSELHTLLEECAYPENTKGTIVRKPTPNHIFWRLYNLIRKSIGYPSRPIM